MSFTEKIALVIPTWNAEKYLPNLLASIKAQTLQPDTILVIDSSSTDQTREILQSYSVKLHVIPQTEFDHGGTRQLATQLVAADIYLYLTQDAILANPEALKCLVEALTLSPDIGCAYGRQLPTPEATPLSAHLRLFNYPEKSEIKSFADRSRLGIKTCFNSNSFAAYRKTALDKIGGFPKKLILGEDVYVAAKMLQQGLKIHYCANAAVYHSHNFNLLQEFKRYFSIGCFHQQEKWIIATFNAPTGEGFKYIAAETHYLLHSHHWYWLPYACLSWVAKFLGYKLGINGKKLPSAWQEKLKY